MAEHLPVLVLLVAMFACAIVPALGMWRARLAWPAAMVGTLAFSACSWGLLARVMGGGGISYRLAGWAPPLGIELRADLLSSFVVAVIGAVALLVMLFARVMVRRELPGREAPFYGVFFVLLLGLAGIVLTGDLFNLYVFFELSSLAGYALMAMGHRKAPVAAFRYLLLGTVGASLYLLGVGYLYVLTGSLNMADVAGRIVGMGGNPALLLSVVFMVVGLGLKMALFPMHLWLPDAYTYASSTATAIIAPVTTKVSAYVLLRMLFWVYDMGELRQAMPLGSVITWLALVGVVVGSVLAIAQKDLKRMLAYSSVAQVAYIGVGIGLGTPLALVGAVLHILNHAAMKMCLFMVSGSVLAATGSTHLRALTGLGRKMPWTFTGFTIAALAMVGIPPTNGFFSKWYLVLGGLQAGDWAVVGVVVASGLLTAVYFFRLLERVYAAEPGPLSAGAVEAGWSLRLPVLVAGVALLVLGLANHWFVDGVLLPMLPPELPGMAELVAEWGIDMPAPLPGPVELPGPPVDAHGAGGH